MNAVRRAWDALEAPWQLALDEAWQSWCTGSAGVGAVVVDAAGTIVARGRNRMMERSGSSTVLAGTPLAHAEMNALAELPFGGGFAAHTIYTTFEPCLMCASTILQTGIGHVRFPLK